MSAAAYVRIEIILLIYPYWNVNGNDVWHDGSIRDLLIYPYWNVNKYDGPIFDDTSFLLIYPYWNVN